MVPQLILIDREGMIHYLTPREGDPASMKEDVMNFADVGAALEIVVIDIAFAEEQRRT